MHHLKSFLDPLYNDYNQKKYITSDPIAIPHQYKNFEDIEAVGFVTALFSYGKVDQIQKSLTNIFSNFSKDTFIKELVRLPDQELEKKLLAAYYRFYQPHDIFILFKFIKNIYREYEHIENLLVKNRNHSNHIYLPIYQRWINFIKNENLTTGLKFMMSDFEKKSANKRILMFYRWMVRKDNIDFGLWNQIQSNELIFPLDTHTSRILYYLGISNTGKANFQEAVHISQKLKLIDENDPVKYDFAISRLGILNECPKKRNFDKCKKCKLYDHCRR